MRQVFTASEHHSSSYLNLTSDIKLQPTRMENIRHILYVALRRRNPHQDLPGVMVKIPGSWSQLRLEQPGSRHAVLKRPLHDQYGNLLWSDRFVPDNESSLTRKNPCHETMQPNAIDGRNPFQNSSSKLNRTDPMRKPRKQSGQGESHLE